MNLPYLRNPSHGADPQDIPGLKVHLSADSIQADPKILICNKTGNIITDSGGASAGWTVGSVGEVIQHASASLSVANPWIATGDSDFAVFCIGVFDIAGSRIDFGNYQASETAAILMGGLQGYLQKDDTDSVQSNTLSPAPTYAFTGAMLLASDKANNEARKFASNGGASLKGVGGFGTITGTWDAFSAYFNATADFVHAGIMLFEDGLPSDAELADAVKYMGAYRVLPPHWRGM